ncbi:hypothetical protein CHU32_22370 [Superficieibacter electus]|uniref:OmpR/PhoB-type domain-containing protein n=1 Tax=Superficieibacter electus TaxID=2022662 RepID=A0A2P5GJF7_9ENTR|nr:hypothetical protein CHU33_22835 [Superficieibacter electus]POP43952.1 hypothetical protein CHU32_22370 [Superficieibacter electus]
MSCSCDSHIKNLRRKLQMLDARRIFIRAVYGVGYRWETASTRAGRPWAEHRMIINGWQSSDLPNVSRKLNKVHLNAC